MLQVNIVALTELTPLLLPGMVAGPRQGDGGRLVAGFQPGPWMAAYFATKAYVLSLGEALAYELRGTGVTVTRCARAPPQPIFSRSPGPATVRPERAPPDDGRRRGGADRLSRLQGWSAGGHRRHRQQNPGIGWQVCTARPVAANHAGADFSPLSHSRFSAANPWRWMLPIRPRPAQKRSIR